MAKAAILHVLEETIGRYVLGLDAQSLNVAVWAGKIQLHSLQLDVQAVNQELTRQAKETPNLAVPFRVVDGSFESLQVDVPWARISSKPVVLRARGLHVVIEPFDHWKHGDTGGENGGGKKKETTRVSARRRRETSSEFFECDAVEEEEEEQQREKEGEGEDCDDEIDDDGDDYDEQDSDHESSIDTPRTTTSTPGMRKKNKKRRPHKNRLKHAIDDQDNDERYHSLEMAEEARQRMNAIRKLGGALDHVQEDDPSQPQPPQLPSQLYGEESTTGTTREASSATGFKARLVRRIIENLQLEIDQVEFQIKGQGCNLGASIDKFTVFTTDKDGNKSFIDRVSNSKNILKSFLYKALDLRGLSVYCDEEQYRTPSYLSQPYRPMEEDRYGKKTFMLSPLSFRARLRQSDCVKCIDFPKYLLSAELPTVSVRLTRMQLEMIHGIMKQISEKKHVVRPLFPEYRPDVPITSKSAKMWWKYAVRSIGRITRKRSWVEFYLAYKKRKRYIDLYKRYMYSADCSWLRPLRISDRAEMDEIECDKSISTQGIMAWRNIADAQAELEMKKYEERQELKKSVAKTTPKKKMSFRSMLFGKKDADAADRTLLYSPKSEDDKDEPPISLTDAEMRELDALALESASAELALSSDSMLCDVTFEMGSFTVDLITFASAPLASLEMGTVLSYFKANADGSFKSTFSLSSLDLHDRITRKSLFPVVIRSLQSSKSDLSFDTFQNAIEVKLTKARNGDQHLEAKIVSYEIVACDFLMKELRKFVTIGKDSSYRKTAPSNPILQYSISGGADLFYDADELGGTTILASTILQDIDQLAKSLTMDQKQPSNFKDKFASAFAEAWKNKLERETIWSVQVDLHAPILVLPQSCIDPSATTLVVDLGTFHMKYGKDLATNVRYWFQQNDHGGTADVKVDNCTMELEHFSLTLTRAGTKDWLRARIDQDNTTEFYESVIDPVTFTLDVGLENGGIQRKCVFGNLEQISLVVSQSQIKRVVSLLSHWSNTMNSVSGKNDENAGVKIFSEDKVCSESVPSSTGKASLRSSTVKGRGRNVGSSDLLHLSFVLKELKVKIVNAKDESLEARLLMATASSTHSDDGSSCIRIRMGHFWVIDYLGGGFPRMQRLVAHSRLPLPPHHYAQEGNYAILESFHSSDCLPIDSLADLNIRKSTHENFENIVDSPFSAGGENVTVTIIDANFSALYLHWNPYAIRNILSFQRDIASLTDQIKPISKRNPGENAADADSEDGIKYLVLVAKLEALQVYLNSAKDDLPVFQMTMSKTNVSIHSLKASEDNVLASIAVGDFTLNILPQTNKINADYVTILGLSPNHASSLLQLDYAKGSLGLQCCPLENFDTKNNEMYVVVKLSPMRFVHIHAVILTLVEYMTEGFLGALAEKVAESAVLAARDLAYNAAVGNKVFHVNAEGFDFILPQSAYGSKHFILEAAKLDLDFISYPSPGEGEANIFLSKVTMKCNRDEKIIDDPISMKVVAKMAPISAQTPHDNATKIKMNVSRINLLLTKQHYIQIMNTLDYNISESDTFLRDSIGSSCRKNQSEDIRFAWPGLDTSRITHGGVEEVVIKKRLYMEFEFDALWLNLYGHSSFDPILSVAAVQAKIDLKLLPDTDTNEFDITLLDLVVEDRRLAAVDRYFTKLVQQVNHGDDEFDVCNVSYIKSKTTNETRLKVSLGSPCVVFIPDAVLEVLLFFEIEKKPPTTVEFDTTKNDSRVQMAPANLNDVKVERKAIHFGLETDDCSFVLIDMGSVPIQGRRLQNESTEEVVVIRAKTSASAKVLSNMKAGELTESEYQIHCDNFEVFSATGVSLLKPVQILSPATLSFFFSLKRFEEKLFTDIAFVSLADLDLIVSMRQYALFLTIASSAKDIFERENVQDDCASAAGSLSEHETDRIKKLASELDNTYDDGSSNGPLVSRQSTNISCSSHGTKLSQDRIIKLKITVPSTHLTVVNDLQGIDEALFKISVSSFLNNTDICLKDQRSDLMFHSHTYMLVNSDYFNKMSSQWEKFLLNPWELDLKAVRGQKKNTRRKATTIDVESHPCEISFSEQFIISLKGAIAMWNIFSETNKKALAIVNELDNQVQMDKQSLSRTRSMARCAARSLTTTRPFGISNRSGLPITFITDDNSLLIEDSETHFFCFPLSCGKGNGGYRLYGQDVKDKKTISIIIGGCQIMFEHLDNEITKGKQVHELRDGLYIFTEAEKTGKSLILRISSFMDVYNHTSLDFSLSLRTNLHKHYLGFCRRGGLFSQQSRVHSSDAFGVNAELLQSVYHSSSNDRLWLEMIFCPGPSNNLRGEIELPPFAAFRQMAESKKTYQKVDVILSPECGKDGYCMTVSFVCKVSLITGYPVVEFFLIPRLVLRNNMFINIFVSTPMPAIYSKEISQNKDQGTEVHHLSPFDEIEIYHAGPSVALAFKCADSPVGGNRTGWNKLGWIDIPLDKPRLSKNICSSFPFLTASGKDSNFSVGCDFYLKEEDNRDHDSEYIPKSLTRCILVSVHNLGVDHTGDVLFESWDINQQYAAIDIRERIGRQNFTFSAYSSSLHKRRISILPVDDSLIRIIHLSIDNIDGLRRSKPFSIEDVPFSDGGIESVPIYWEDSTESGYFMYRKLSSLDQSELHVIPEFVVFNGGASKVRATIQKFTDIAIDEGKMARVRRSNSREGLVISIAMDEQNCMCAPVQVDQLGLKVVLLRSCKTGSPVGSLAIQTVLGAKDSRFVVKLGPLKHGNVVAENDSVSLFERDYLHFRVRCSQLEVTFLDTSQKRIFNDVNEDDVKIAAHSNHGYKKIAHFLLERFTLDYQKLFKEDAKMDAARSQFSAIIHSIHVSDCTADKETSFLSSSFDDHNFLDMRVRTRGSGDAGLAKIDLLEIKIAHSDRKANPVVINTNEAFLWNLLDIASRTNSAISEFTSTDTNVEWNEDTQSFRVQAVDIENDDDDDVELDGTYRAPRSDMLLSVKKMYVWPSAFLVSFRRNPQSSRYHHVKNVKSAKFVTYFIQKLNFTVDKAHLHFAGFSCTNMKGPPDRIIDSVKAFYLSQIKKKLFILLTATSIDEWRLLSGRDDGKESYVEGDILRTTGNLAGRSAGYLVKKVGQGIGKGLSAGTAEVGNGIQTISEAIGVGAVGAGVNSLVSGIGEGVGSTVEGVGSGGNKIIKGAGKGVGQLVGGVGGGLQQVAIGFGKGVLTGDGKAILTGIGDGVTSIGTGVVKGTESVVTGAAEGVFHVGKGLITGMASLGKGVGNAVQGKTPKRKHNNSLPPPSRHHR